MKSILIFSLLSCFFAAYKAKVLTKCQVAQDLKAQGMDGFHGFSLADWVCLAEYKSNLNTQALKGKNADGSSAYGIFQLKDSWCKNNTPSSESLCDIPCSKLVDDDITDDIVCVKKVAKDPKKMSAWVPSVKHCKSKDLSKYLADCEL